MGFPKKAVYEDQLDKQTAGFAAIGGAHTIIKVKLIDEGVTKLGFFKPIDPKNHYPELLGKFSVAASIFLRLFLGKRAADERLVLNREGQIVGTLSIALEGFQQFNYADEPIPTDLIVRERVIPSTQTLIDNNYMELLLATLFFDNDDDHPHNRALIGILDYDMYFYPFTIYMKEPRPGVGVPKNWFTFTVADWEDFPRIRDAKLYHFPGNSYPGEHSLPSIIPMPNLASQVLPKHYADPKQFQLLANNPKAKEQQMAAAMKFLLTYQPELLRKRLEDAFGDFTLDYTSLDAVSVELRTLYEQKFPNLCNSKSNKDTFVNFMMNMYQIHYDNIYRVVVFHRGCDKNLSREPNMAGIPLPATNFALYQKPSYYRDVEAWMKEQNKTAHANNPSMQYNLSELEQRYHQVWRDANAPALKEQLDNCHNLCCELQQLACAPGIFKPLSEGKKTTDPISSALEIFGTMPSFSQTEILMDKENQYGEAFKLLLKFTQSFQDIVKKYYLIERKNLTQKDNTDFVHALNDILKAANNPIRRGLYHTSSPATKFAHIAESLNQLISQADFTTHLTTTDQQMSAVSVKIIAKELPPIDSDEVINQFNDSLFVWAKSLPADVFERLIKDIIENKYEKTLGILTANRHRGPVVKDYLAHSVKVSNDIRLAYILTSGTKDEGSLNTLLIENLAAKVMEKHTNASVSKALREGTFNKVLSRFTTSAINFAKNDKRFTDVPKLFYETLYSMVDNLPSAEFKGIVNSSLNEYVKNLSSFRWSETREKEVKGYLDSKDLSQSNIVAFIFLKGEDTSSLNLILFKKLTVKMQDIISKSKANANPGYQLMAEFTEKSHPHIYRDVKLHAVAASNKRVPSLPPAAAFASA